MNADPFAAQQVTQDTFADYAGQVRDFQADRVRSARRSARIAWTVAAASGVLAAVLGGAVAALAPLKSIELRTIVVDRATGAGEVLRSLSQPPETVDEAHVRHMAWLYMAAREGYSAAEDEDNYRRVLLMTAPEQQADFSRWFYGAEGPRKEIGAGGTARVKVASLQILAGADGIADRVVVRFAREIRRAGPLNTTETQYWVSTIRFAWSRGAIRADDRLVNPFGWLVVDYRRDPETPR